MLQIKRVNNNCICKSSSLLTKMDRLGYTYIGAHDLYILKQNKVKRVKLGSVNKNIIVFKLCNEK